MKVWKRAIGAVTAGALLAASLAGCSGDGTYSADMAEYAYEKGAPSLCQAYEDYFQVGAAINPRAVGGQPGELLVGDEGGIGHHFPGEQHALAAKASEENI